MVGCQKCAGILPALSATPPRLCNPCQDTQFQRACVLCVQVSTSPTTQNSQRVNFTWRTLITRIWWILLRQWYRVWLSTSLVVIRSHSTPTEQILKKVNRWRSILHHHLKEYPWSPSWKMSWRSSCRHQQNLELKVGLSARDLLVLCC